MTGSAVELLELEVLLLLEVVELESVDELVVVEESSVFMSRIVSSVDVSTEFGSITLAGSTFTVVVGS
jgi:hypothetical protein